jgi:methylthioribose-1-phosphate isomerase
VSTMRTLEWVEEKHCLKMIDQRRLPGHLEFYECHDAEEVAFAIRTMVVRGAPAIGVAAAFGYALAALRINTDSVSEMRLELAQKAEVLRNSRPTAVNLMWALERMAAVTAQTEGSTNEIRTKLLNEALLVAEEDVATNRKISEIGASLIEDGDTIIHHCNTGALAMVDWGTALGVIHFAHLQGKKIHVLVDETRPRLQGARLTAWELGQWGVPYEIITDNAAGYFLRSGEVKKVFFGADRVAANGDLANKVGTYMLSLAAHANQVPVYSVFPITTIDLKIKDGNQIPIEERDPSEVLSIEINGERVTPQGAKARNPSFDVTPHELISAWVTEKGIVREPFLTNLQRLLD